MKVYNVEGVEFSTDISEMDIETAEWIIAELNKTEEFPVCKLIVKKLPNGEYDCDYYVKPPKFERIRRITGYLSGTLDSWNNSKRAEESERVKHA